MRFSTLGTCVAVLASAGMADALLRWLVRRKVRRDAAAAETAPAARSEVIYWIDQGLKEAVPPLALLIWLVAARIVVSVLLAAVADQEFAATAARAVDVLGGAATIAAFVWLLSRIGRVVDARLAQLASRTANAWDDVLLAVAGKAARRLLPLVALILGVPALAVSPDLQGIVRNGLSLVIIGTVAFMLYQVVEAVEKLVLQRYRIDVRDNLEARAVHTQVTVLKKVATVVIAIFTIASMLMVFESVRQFGTSILASAGIAGIIIGFAAQQSIATLLAGLQIAVTQPVRIDDVVIVENEWGRIEDITLTYVIVRIWDERRLIVPITYFIERPFQNWTRTSAEILGTVFLHVDYSVPLDAVRAELDRILAESPYWDGKVKVLQVTDAKERSLEVRALASAADASLAWDLRCEVREKLIRFLQQQHPESLPRVRAELHAAPIQGV